AWCSVSRAGSVPVPPLSLHDALPISRGADVHRSIVAVDRPVPSATSRIVLPFRGMRARLVIEKFLDSFCVGGSPSVLSAAFSPRTLYSGIGRFVYGCAVFPHVFFGV